MKVGMIAQGSNGDVEIFVALALGLIKHNHEVELVIITINNRDYSFLSQYHGLTIHQKHVHFEFKNNCKDLEFWNKPQGESDEVYKELYNLIQNDLIGYSCILPERNDLLIGPAHLYELACMAEKFNKPYVSVNYHLEIYRNNLEPPFKLSSESPFEPSNLEGLSNDKLWDIYESLYNAALKRRVNGFRKKQGMLPARNVFTEIIISKFLNLIPYSTYLFKAKPGWNSSLQLCGYLKSSNDYNDWKIPEDLRQFMKGRNKPVFITVGSMAEHENEKEFQDLLMKTARLISRKVIILTNWEHGNTIEGNVYKLKGFISYPAILQKCSLVVHHGGVGTLHNATEAGCPSIIIKYGHDQPYNAKILYDLGISNGSVNRQDLNPEGLAKLVNEALKNKTMKKRAEALARLLRKENGVEKAVEIIERRFNHHKSKISKELSVPCAGMKEPYSSTVSEKI